MRQPPYTNTTLDALQDARQFIDDHFADPLALDQISDCAHLSRYHFIRLFRRTFHETPHEYLTRRRIERAKELLAQSDMPVTDICFDVGFESLGSFSTLFRKVVGWPPSMYRARSLEQRRTPLKFIPHCFVVTYGLSPIDQESNFREAANAQVC